ncbi:MAG TPA: hypothetical protein DDZ89_13465, partial [Clostridiales bacterium]|nr:hypothetical protein [Clostridiales bacterium]
TIKALADSQDFTKGYLYYMVEGQDFVIPLGNESMSAVDEVIISLKNPRLQVSGTTNLSYTVNYESGAEFTELDGYMEVINTNPEIAMLQDGVVTALKRGKTEFYVKIRRNGETVRSDRYILEVTIPKGNKVKVRTINCKVEMPM